MTAFGTLETAVAAIRSGAYDFITKPVELEMLALTIARAVERRRLAGQIHLLEEQAKVDGGFGDLLGRVRQCESCMSNFVAPLHPIRRF